MRLEAVAAGTASWTGNPFLPPPREPGRRPRRNSRARRAAPRGGGGRWRVLPSRCLPSPPPRRPCRPLPPLPHLSSPPRARLASGPPSLLLVASPGRRNQLRPRAQTRRLVVPFHCVRGRWESGEVPLWKSRGKCLETTVGGYCVWGGENKCICSRVPDCSPPPCMAVTLLWPPQRRR